MPPGQEPLGLPAEARRSSPSPDKDHSPTDIPVPTLPADSNSDDSVGSQDEVLTIPVTSPALGDELEPETKDDEHPDAARMEVSAPAVEPSQPPMLESAVWQQVEQEREALKEERAEPLLQPPTPELAAAEQAEQEEQAVQEQRVEPLLEVHPGGSGLRQWTVQFGPRHS